MRTITMVLATDNVAPITAPSSRLQPNSFEAAMAIPICSAIPTGAPMSATHFTRIRSGIENSTPMENISRTTPTSASTSK